MTVGATRGTVFQEVRPGAGLKNGDFVKEKLEGLPQNKLMNVFIPRIPPPATGCHFKSTR